MNLKNIRKIIVRGEILEREPMSRHTSFQVGGPARYMIRPASVSELSGLLRYLSLNGIPYFVLGNGSNLLVSDQGYDGCVIDLGRHDGTEFTMLGIDDGTDADSTCKEGEILFDAGAGCLMESIGQFAQRFSASGFEALWGIPGCVGGACVMNAGAYGAEMKDVIRSVTAVTARGEVRKLAAKELDFGYRSTSLMKEGMLVARAELLFHRDDPEKIRARMEEYKKRREEKQPLALPSAGSTFKRPEGYFAGQLIEEAGLRGFALGGAQVSEKHAGFIVNRGGATAEEIYRLIRTVQARVQEHSGVLLQPEVRMLGSFPAI